ncbi:MAG: aminotransferase class I/II-fold pyridoxal phosphate-dependent enzyme [Betaproteobacteria bacterium]|nr:aminotransferase class I/II-fold pyridoxal phosphate-dependent enzyme [Betaproteobacteria bacterium]
MTLISPEEFLERCTESSQTTYDLLKKLLDEALTPEGRAETRRFLTRLRKACDESELNDDEFLAQHHFTFNTLALDNGSGGENALCLLQLPSIFTPEDWSFTFFEGLARYPASEFQGRVVAELGCGNGWISIALAAKASPQKILGLDINPRAITCARLNLLLNALDDSGTPKIDHEGKSLLDRVEFHVSDLLSYPIEKRISLDRVIGCIPQVLSPEPLVAAQFVSEDADDNFLYSLSNYCEKQGYVEDQFGLGLIARALEESIAISKPAAKVILNLGGRPGTAVLERLLSRRGFSVKKIWSTKVWQAADTDILPLVEIENITPHRFEFFTSLTSDEPICARTALEYQKRGGQIAHSLSVYEAQIKYPSAVRSIFKLIGQTGFEDSRNGLDLAFANDELAEEKINFIGGLAEWLQQKPNLPYSDAEGEPQLRRQIAQFLRSYWKIPLTAKSVFVTPNRKAALKNHIQMLRPRLTLIQKDLTQHIPPHWLNASSRGANTTPGIVEAPKRVDEICKLVLSLEPQLVICSLQDFEVRTSDAFVRLVETCTRVNAQLIVDLSDHFELSSQPAPHGVLSWLSEHPLPGQVTLLFALVRNRVYSDLELSFLITENLDLLERMTAAAELTYSRTPLLTQRYFGKIFADLLNFQLTDLRRSKSEQLRLPRNPEATKMLPLPENIVEAFQHPAIAVHSLELSPQHVRLDYGENCLASPLQLDSAIMESYLRQNISAHELNCEKPVIEMVEKRFGLNHFTERNVVLGLGVAPLFCAALEMIASRGETIALPTGAYGYFRAACDYVGVPCAMVQTSDKNRFKITTNELDQFLSEKRCQWLYLNGPIVNPTGVIYSNGEILDLLDVLERHKCGLIFDTIFSGLEFNGKHTHLSLSRFRQARSEQPPASKMIVLGGLSKELAAGGLRLGWAVTEDDELAQNLRARVTGTPHATVRYAARKIYLALNDANHSVQKELEQQKATLRSRAEKLTTALTELGWDVIEPEGGLFVCASPQKYLEGLGRDVPESQLRTAADDIATQLRIQTGLLVNSATWTGLPHQLRFVISVEEETLESGIERLKQFDSNWQNQGR